MRNALHCATRPRASLNFSGARMSVSEVCRCTRPATLPPLACVVSLPPYPRDPNLELHRRPLVYYGYDTPVSKAHMDTAVSCCRHTLLLALLVVSFTGVRDAASPPPPPSPAATTNLVGYARFLGPVSAGCQVNYVAPDGSAGTSTAGQVSVAPYRTVNVLASATCTDLFTGVPIPYNLAGKSPANAAFQVSSTNTIGAASDILAAPASYSYSRISTEGSTAPGGVTLRDQTGAGAATLETADLFAAVRKGNSTAWKLLTADLQFIMQSVVMANAFVNASRGSGTCKTTSQAQAALAKWYTESNRWVSFGVLSPISATQSMLVTCGINQPASGGGVPVSSAEGQRILLEGPGSEAVQRTINILAVSMPMRAVNGPAAMAMANYARWASMLSTTTITALNAMTNGTAAAVEAAINSALDAATIVPEQIASFLGLSGYAAPQATDVRVSAVGPLRGATVTFQAWFARANSSLPTLTVNDNQTMAVVTNPLGTLGFYNVKEGATDVFLTSNPANPVVTLAPMLGIIGFTTPGVSVTFSPIATLVGQAWFNSQLPGTGANATGGDMPAPAAVSSTDWYNAYVGVLGEGFLDKSYNYLTRDYPSGSNSAAAVMLADTLVQAMPGLVGGFVSKAIAGQVNRTKLSLAATAGAVYMALQSVPALQYGNTTFITMLTKQLYAAGTGTNITSNTGRRLMQSVALDSIISNVASAIGSSNQLMLVYLPQIALAVTTGSNVPQALFINIAKVAAVQNQDLAAALANIAALVSAGDLSGAQSAASQAATDFSGINLLARVATKSVSTDAINAATAGGGGGSSSSNKLALGVGLGVGLGVLLVAVIVVVVVVVRTRRSRQVAAPSQPAAE